MDIENRSGRDIELDRSELVTTKNAWWQCATGSLVTPNVAVTYPVTVADAAYPPFNLSFPKIALGRVDQGYETTAPRDSA